jgi:hypothetical protein
MLLRPLAQNVSRDDASGHSTGSMQSIPRAPLVQLITMAEFIGDTRS